MVKEARNIAMKRRGSWDDNTVIELEPKVWPLDHASSEETANLPIGPAACADKEILLRNAMYHLQPKNQPVDVSAPSTVCGQISCMDPASVLS
jgi:hypothetical protein